MNVPWKDLILAMGGAALMKAAFGGGGGSLAEPIVRERFVEQPMAVYLERIVWQLTRDFDVVRLREVRNLLNARYNEVEECYRYQLPPDEVARRVEAMVLGQGTTFVPQPEPVAGPSMQGESASEPSLGVTGT